MKFGFRFTYMFVGLTALVLSGCSRITARNLDPHSCEREGIPFYLPKPYLVVAKNVRFVPPPTIGLTQPAPVPETFDANARELEMKGTISETRTLALERKLAEESKFSRTEADTISRTLEDKLTRMIEEKFDRLEENKQSESTTSTNTVSTTKSEATADNKSVTRTDSSTTTTEANESARGAAPAQGGYGATQLQGDGGDEAPGATMARNQVLGVSNPPIVPAGVLPDGLMPFTFYTFHVLYLPDLTQKYGLVIHNGPGEFRSTMNLVNGWMHTGAGQIYMRDSTTAANTVATGLAVGNVIDALAGLGFAGAGPIAPTSSNAALANALAGLQGGTQLQGKAGRPTMNSIADYAELYIYEPNLIETIEDGCRVKRVTWRMITDGPIRMDRDWLTTSADSAAGSQGRTGSPDGAEARLEQLRAQIDADLPRLLSENNIRLADGRPATKVGPVERREQVMRIRLGGKLAPGEEERLTGLLTRYDRNLGFSFE